MNLSNIYRLITNSIYGFINPLARFENKLVRCQGYRHKTVRKWQKNSGLPVSVATKILHNLHIFDGSRVRELIRKTIESRPDIFAGGKLYITGFGPPGKSGGLVLYDFTRSLTFPTNIAHMSIETSQIAELPSGSKIVFVDDLIGTGTQSLKYIGRLSTLLSSSHEPYLFSVCATPEGLKNVRENSIFDVVCGQELPDAEFNHYYDGNQIFTTDERTRLRGLNKALGQNPYDLGLLIAFYYTTPNNTMPIIWKDGAKYFGEGGEERAWYALIRRKF